MNFGTSCLVRELKLVLTAKFLDDLRGCNNDRIISLLVIRYIYDFDIYIDIYD